MTETKILEVTDRYTFIPVLAVRVCAGFGSGSDYLLRRAGFARREHYVILSRLSGNHVTYDPAGWGDRTLTTAHQYILDNWDTIADGAVVDVEFICGEVSKPRLSESEPLTQPEGLAE